MADAGRPAAQLALGDRYNADQTVTAFAVQLKDAVDLNNVCDEVARVVQTALEPAHVSVWTSRRG